MPSSIGLDLASIRVSGSLNLSSAPLLSRISQFGSARSCRSCLLSSVSGCSVSVSSLTDSPVNPFSLSLFPFLVLGPVFSALVRARSDLCRSGIILSVTEGSWDFLLGPYRVGSSVRVGVRNLLVCIKDSLCIYCPCGFNQCT